MCTPLEISFSAIVLIWITALWLGLSFVAGMKAFGEALRKIHE